MMSQCLSWRHSLYWINFQTLFDEVDKSFIILLGRQLNTDAIMTVSDPSGYLALPRPFLISIFVEKIAPLFSLLHHILGRHSNSDPNKLEELTLILSHEQRPTGYHFYYKTAK